MTVISFHRRSIIAVAALGIAAASTGGSARPVETSAAEVAAQRLPLANPRMAGAGPVLDDIELMRRQSMAAACRAGDANGFVQLFIATPSLRHHYTAPTVEMEQRLAQAPYSRVFLRRIPLARYRDFPLESVDYYFKPVHPVRAGDTDEYVMLEVNQSQSSQISAEWTRLHFVGESSGGDDQGEPVRLDGTPYHAGDGRADGQLLFEPWNGCWRLVADNRYVGRAR